MKKLEEDNPEFRTGTDQQTLALDRFMISMALNRWQRVESFSNRDYTGTKQGIH